MSPTLVDRLAAGTGLGEVEDAECPTTLTEDEDRLPPDELRRLREVEARDRAMTAWRHGRGGRA